MGEGIACFCDVQSTQKSAASPLRLGGRMEGRAMLSTRLRGLGVALVLGLGACVAPVEAEPEWLLGLAGDARFDGVQPLGPYDYGVLDERLAAGPELSEVLGFDRVETDLQAAYVIRASYVVPHSAFEVVREEQEELRVAAEREGALEPLLDGVDPGIEPLAILNGVPTDDQKEVVRLHLSGVGCTGVMVSNRVILTAAHCVVGRGRLGPNEVRGSREGRFLVTERTVHGDRRLYARRPDEQVQLVRHPQYGGQFDWAWDVGLVILPRAVSHQTPGRFFAAQADGRRPDEVDSAFRVYGWGTYTDTGGGTDRRWADLRANAPDWGNQEQLQGGVIIPRGDVSRAATPCAGDSGGAWTIETDEGRRITAGVDSSGNAQLGNCSEWWSTNYAAAIGPKFGWVIAEARGAGAQLECNRYSSSGIRYYRCRLEPVYFPGLPPIISPPPVPPIRFPRR